MSVRNLISQFETGLQIKANTRKLDSLVNPSPDISKLFTKTKNDEVVENSLEIVSRVLQLDLKRTVERKREEKKKIQEEVIVEDTKQRVKGEMIVRDEGGEILSHRSEGITVPQLKLLPGFEEEMTRPQTPTNSAVPTFDSPKTPELITIKSISEPTPGSSKDSYYSIVLIDESLGNIANQFAAVKLAAKEVSTPKINKIKEVYERSKKNDTPNNIDELLFITPISSVETNSCFQTPIQRSELIARSEKSEFESNKIPSIHQGIAPECSNPSYSQVNTPQGSKEEYYSLPVVNRRHVTRIEDTMRDFNTDLMENCVDSPKSLTSSNNSEKIRNKRKNLLGSIFRIMHLGKRYKSVLTFNESFPRKLISNPTNVRDIAYEAYSKKTGIAQVHPVVQLLKQNKVEKAKKVDIAIQTEPISIPTAFEMARNSIIYARKQEKVLNQRRIERSKEIQLLDQLRLEDIERSILEFRKSRVKTSDELESFSTYLDNVFRIR